MINITNMYFDYITKSIIIQVKKGKGGEDIMTRVLYPGSFDPITKGHMDIIWQASNLFDEVVVAVMQNYSKKISFFSIEERLEMIKYLYRDMSNIKVISGSGATVDVAIQNECKAIIRGLRSLSDYDYEVTMQEINREISNNMINTICLFADTKYQSVSSSMVKELFNLDKDIIRYVEPTIKEKMLIKKRSIVK